MRRFVLSMLVLASAGCATGRPPVTWLEPVYDPPRPEVHARIFHFNRRWDFGSCSLHPGSHVTLRRHGPARTGFAVSATAAGTRWRYGVTFLDANGKTLAHFPYPGGGVYVITIPMTATPFISGPYIRLPPHLYDQVARVLIHASC